MNPNDEEKVLTLNCGLHRRHSIRSTPDCSPRSASPREPLLWSPAEETTPPETIVLGLWPYATDEQIRYYVEGYEALYPDAALLLLRYSTSYDRQLGEALDALTASQEKRPLGGRPNVLLHLFSGCGAASGCRLLRTYKIRTGERLPVKAVILDSVPALRIPTLRAAQQSPFLLLSFFYIFLTMLFVRIVSTVGFWQFEQRSRQNRHDLNNPYLIPPDANKCYIFESSDLMFSWHDTGTRDHDEESIRDDISVKRTSIDEKGKLTGDQERYWLGIDNAWNGST